MSASEALRVIDAKLALVLADPFGITSGSTLAIVLTEIRDAVTADPDWSEVVEANLRAELERARGLAVLLEAELRQHEQGKGRRAL